MLRTEASPPGNTANNERVSEAEPSEARFRTWLFALLALVGPPLLFLYYYRAMFPGLTNPDALDFAQIGRNLSSGQGFVTHILRPLALSPEYGNNPLRMPDVTHGPLYPLLLAIAFGAFGAKDSVAAGVSGLFYLLTIPVVYQLGKQAFNRNVGLAAALIVTFNALLLEYAASGLHLTLIIFLATSMFLAIYRIAERARTYESDPEAGLPKGALVAAGSLAGLLYLTDPIYFFLLPAALGTVIWVSGTRRFASTLWFAVPLAILVLPWMARNGMLTGSPIFGLRGQEIVMGTRVYPGYSAYRLTPDEVTPGMALFRSVVKKILLSTGLVIQAFPQVTASWVLAFFLPSLFFRFRNPSANRVRTSVMYCFLGILVGTLLFTLQMPLFVSLIPAMLIFSAAYLLYLVRQAELSRNGTFWVGALVATAVVYPLASALFLNDRPQALPEAASAAVLSRFVEKGDIILSDEPWIPAWHAGRPSLWLPRNNAKLAELTGRFDSRVKGLLLTRRAAEASPVWGEVHATFYQRVNLPWAMYAGAKRSYDEKKQADPRMAVKPPAPPGEMRITGRLPENVEPNLGMALTAMEGFTVIPSTGASLSTVTAAVLPRERQ